MSPNRLLKSPSTSIFLSVTYLLLFILLLPHHSLAKPTSSSPTKLPTIGGLDLSKFDQYETGFFANKNVSLYWSVENNGDIYSNRDQVIHMALVLNVTGSMAVAYRSGNMSNTWVGLGLGSCMLASEFIMVHALPDGVGVEILELVSTGYFKPPMPNPSGTSMLAPNPPGSPPHVLYQGNGVLLAEFRRYTTPSDGESTHVPLDLNKEYTNILLACNSNPIPTPSESWKIYHGRNTPTGNRQKFVVNLKNGDWKVYFGGSIESKMLHGVGMGFTFMILNPAAVYWARYVKSIKGFNRGWMWVHMGLQCCTVTLAISFASEGVWKSKFKVRRHTWDWVLKSLEKKFGSSWGNGSRVNVMTGFTLGGVGVGVNGSGKGGWWQSEKAAGKVKSFGLFNKDLDVKDEKEATVGDDWKPTFGKEISAAPRLTFRKGPGKSGFTIVRPSVPTTILENAAVVKKDEKSEKWKTFTWTEIDEALKNRENYVIANGKYVYDINQWIYTHPGGSIVLQQVAGTDVTNDYFNESGYDASAFVPKQALSRTLGMSNAHRHLPTVVEPVNPQERSVESLNLQSQSHPLQPPIRKESKPPSLISSFRAAELLLISENEWKLLVKARRTNVHSKLAIEKLSSLMVGEISQEEREQTNLLGGGFRFLGGDDDENGGSGIEFSPMEYRRYALIDTQLVSEVNCQNPVYKQKFCILYPFDTRKNEPTEFLPGQCIEIQMKVKNTIISRYYTPQSGSPTCFEVHVKLVRQGQLTPQLIRQRLGDRQIKIRGPFGTPLLSLVRGFSGNGRFGLSEFLPVSFDRMLFVCGGSGLAPLIHYLEWMFLPKHVPLYVIQSYEASQPDEISLNEGDWVTVSEHLHDGWAMGRNQRTGQEGLFPLPITIPRCGLNARIAIVNAVRTPQEAFGSKVLRSVLLAYPTHATSVTHCLSRWNNDNSQATTELLSDACPGDVVPGRVNVGVIVDSLDRCKWVSNITLNKKVVLCGPQSFEGAMMDVLERCGIDHQDILILPPSTY
ncbi:hypothetical protein HDU76_004907, partial [Blyttiomyces sp. JEL0837]